MDYNSNKSDDEKQERNATIIAIGAIIFAIRPYATLVALGFACCAHVAAVQNEPVVGLAD